MLKMMVDFFTTCSMLSVYFDYFVFFYFFNFLAPLKRTSSWSFDEKLLIQSLYKVLTSYCEFQPQLFGHLYHVFSL